MTCRWPNTQELLIFVHRGVTTTVQDAASWLKFQWFLADVHKLTTLESHAGS